MRWQTSFNKYGLAASFRHAAAIALHATTANENLRKKKRTNPAQNKVGVGGGVGATASGFRDASAGARLTATLFKVRQEQKRQPAETILLESAVENGTGRETSSLYTAEAVPPPM